MIIQHPTAPVLQKSEHPTPLTIAQSMHRRIRKNILELFPDKHNLLENFDSGCYPRCQMILYDMIHDHKAHRQLSKKTQQKREQLFQMFSSWHPRLSQLMKDAAPQKQP